MAELGTGLYEALVTEGLKAQLDALADRLPARVRDLRAAEAPDRIAWHLSKQIEAALADVGDSERVGVGLAVARALLDRLGELVTVDPAALPADPATILHAVLRRLPDGRPEEIDEPLIPLLDTTLLTNAPGEPNLWNQLRSEIESSDSIDLVMAFIRRSGISPLIDVEVAWKEHLAVVSRKHIAELPVLVSIEAVGEPPDVGSGERDRDQPAVRHGAQALESRGPRQERQGHLCLHLENRWSRERIHTVAVGVEGHLARSSQPRAMGDGARSSATARSPTRYAVQSCLRALVLAKAACPRPAPRGRGPLARPHVR